MPRPPPRTGNAFQALGEDHEGGEAWTEVAGRPREEPSSPGQRPARQKTEPCAYWARGYCQRGDSCFYSHEGPPGRGRGQQHSPPTGAPSPHGRPQPAAAGRGQPPPRRPQPPPPQQQQQPTGVGMVFTPLVHPSDARYKSKMCFYWPQGRCGRGDECSFAHSEGELHGRWGGSDRAQSEDGREREAPPLAAFFPAEAGNGAPGTAAPARSGSGGGGGGGQPQGQASDFPALGDANGGGAGSEASSEGLGELELDAEHVDFMTAPDSFCCPITHEILRNPVVASDGYSYEKSAIQDWLRRHDTSPMTNEALESKELVPNRALRAVIRVLYALAPA